MDMPIYKLFLVKYTDAWYQLTPEEQQKLATQVDAALEQVGGKRVVMAVSMWSNEQWSGFGVEQFPSLEAAVEHTKILWKLNWYRYIESETYQGIEFKPEMWV
jgi:hypothetical protein